MAKRFQIQLVPTGGSIVQTTAVSTDLMRPADSSGTRFITSDVGGYNFDITTRAGECRKCVGYSKWGDEPAATGDVWQSYLFLDDGTNVDPCGIYGGKFYTFSSAGAATNIDAASPVTFATGAPISLMQYGAYSVMGSIGVTPYKWKHGDLNLTKLIQSGTEYKFKYFEKFYNTIIGAYSDQTNGNIDVRWTDPLPSFGSLSFPVANQLYKPDDDIGITGIKTLGNMQCLLYGRKSVHNMVYNAGVTPVFSIQPMASNVGTDSPYSIIDSGRSHVFFDRNRGFVELFGAESWTVISDDILPWIQSITRGQYSKIVGGLSPGENEYCWAVPTSGNTVPDTLLYYNFNTKKWQREYRPVSALAFYDYLAYKPFSWLDLRSQSPNSPRWPTSGTWDSYLTSYVGNMLMGNTTGYSYWLVGQDFDGADYGAYRNEPIFGNPDPSRDKRIQEIWFGFTDSGDYDLEVYWRTGDTEQEVKSAEWVLQGTVSAAQSDTNFLPIDQVGKYHQLRWGTGLKNEIFKVSDITIRGMTL